VKGISLVRTIRTIAFLISILGSNWLYGDAREILRLYEIEPDGEDVLQRLSSQFELTSRKDGKVRFLVPADRDTVREYFPTARLIESDHFLAELQRSGFDHPNQLAGYRKIDQVYDHLSSLAGMHPSIVQLTQYGTSQRGRPLYVLKISDRVQYDEDEPEIMLTSATHGDELITVEVVLALIDELIAGYGKDPRLTAMVQERELFFIPVVNADGFATQSRYSNGVDPNRNFPWPGNQNVQSEATARNIMAFFESRDIVAAMDFHASGEMIMYPWAYTYNPPPAEDERRFRAIGQSMAQANGYAVGQISKIIYVAQGSSADYWYWNKSTLAFGIEMAQSKVPPVSSIPRVVEDNRESTWRFIEAVQ
jgi:carboxypeptidase T